MLKVRRDICQKDDRRRVVALGQGGGEMLENIQRHGARLAGVHVPHVFAGPPEGLAGHDLETGQVDAALAEEFDMFLGEILSHNPDEVHWAEIRCGNRTIRSRAAKQVFMLGELCFDVIQRDRTNNKNGHRRGRMRIPGLLCEKKCGSAGWIADQCAKWSPLIEGQQPRSEGAWTFSEGLDRIQPGAPFSFTKLTPIGISGCSSASSVIS